ncbi:MAG TPA: GDSL-type esterase/lipase family protein [Burkholderiaceae bacterium]
MLTDVVGRSDSAPDGSVRFGYPGVSFLLEFEGRTLSVDAASSGSRSLLDVRIDGGASQVIALSTEPRCVVLLSEAYSARHQVEIMHRSETWHGIVSIREFSFDGSLAPGAPPPQRKIMLLGDSVTCGEAIDRADGGGEAGSRSNPRLSYGMLAASALHAQAVLVCYGGRGLVRSWNGRTDELNLPDFFQLAIADPANLVRWDHARYDPDVIVCAIGTNDFTEGIPEREAYVDAYAGFVATLLRTHKRAQIVLTEGAILDGDKKSALSAYLAQTVARVADSRVRVVRSRHYPGDASDAHPTREQHAEMAQDLAEQLRTIMNW